MPISATLKSERRADIKAQRSYPVRQAQHAAGGGRREKAPRQPRTKDGQFVRMSNTLLVRMARLQ